MPPISHRTGSAPCRSGARTVQRTLNYFVCDNLETLLYVANMGSIPLHIWASRADSLELPDWCIIDLDPKGSAVLRTW
jgi:bifunctional non-homologous end joining protein LigD